MSLRRHTFHRRRPGDYNRATNDTTYLGFQRRILHLLNTNKLTTAHERQPITQFSYRNSETTIYASSHSCSPLSQFIMFSPISTLAALAALAALRLLPMVSAGVDFTSSCPSEYSSSTRL